MFLWRGGERAGSRALQNKNESGYNEQPNTGHLYETHFSEECSGKVGSDFAGRVRYARVLSGAGFACGIAVDSLVRTITVPAGPGLAGTATLG
jgi:hypothetical protein